MNVEMIHPAQNTVGESLVWDDLRCRLIWVDIIAKRIHRLDPKTGHHESWETPDFVTSVGLRKDGGAVIGLTKQICTWEFSDEFQPLADIEPDLPDNRLNEGVVGPDGAFWIGTMQNNIAPDGSPADMDRDSGRIYRCTPDGQVTPVCDDIFGLTNTFVWTKEGGFVTADTLRNEVYHYRYNADKESLSDRKTILAGFERGLPDGSCMDAEGYIWNCRVVGGACLIRMDHEGNIDRTVNLPCTWPTSCTFGGKNLNRLFVTSARFTMPEDHLSASPQEGGLFAIDVGVSGMSANRFG